MTVSQAYKLGPSEPAQYALEGSIAIAGAGVSWLKDNLRIIDSPEESATLAASVDSTGGLQGPSRFIYLGCNMCMITGPINVGSARVIVVVKPG